MKNNLNYGSVLQCFALEKYLSDRGHEASVVRDYRMNPIILLRRLKNIRYFRSFCAKLYAQRQVSRFIKNRMLVSKNMYLSYSGLVKKCPDADLHIACSDQIWRNANISRFLSYVPDEKKKISYAASFGQVALSEEMKSIVEPLLRRFDGLGVREQAGVNILHSVGLEGQLVLDPTLLLDSDIYPSVRNEAKVGYSYCYFVNLKKQSDIPFEAIKEYARDYSLEALVSSPTDYRFFQGEKLLFPSVEEWLGLFQGANCIFTNT